VGQVAVVRVDDPFAILEGVRVKEFRVLANLVGLVLRVTRQRQPQAGHPFAEPRRSQQAVHEPLQRFRSRVREKRRDLFRRGWQAGQVERGAANQSAPIRFGRGSEPALLEPGEDEVIDALLRPASRAHLRRRLSHRRPKRPELPLPCPVNRVLRAEALEREQQSGRAREAVFTMNLADRLLPEFRQNAIVNLERLYCAMLKVTGNGSITTCDGITRRDFLQVGTLGALGFSMANFAALQALGATDAKQSDKACILIFNLGAPSQLDTFDPKPDAPREIRGPFKAISTASPDIQLTEILPQHAKLADKFSLVRSCYHTAAAVHDTGHQMMQTGRLFQGGINTPHAGCALEYLRGRKTELPAHVILPEPMGPTGGNLPHGQDAGFLGKNYDPFVLGVDPSKKDFKVPDLLPPQEIGEARLARRRELRAVVDDTVKSFEASENAKLMDANFANAYRLMTSTKAREAFDLAKEPEKLRERYGMTRFGQCCLLARRLVEAGVRFVTINTFITVFDEITWD